MIYFQNKKEINSQEEFVMYQTLEAIMIQLRGFKLNAQNVEKYQEALIALGMAIAYNFEISSTTLPVKPITYECGVIAPARPI